MSYACFKQEEKATTIVKNRNENETQTGSAQSLRARCNCLSDPKGFKHLGT